jgi:hypothetical protein
MIGLFKIVHLFPVVALCFGVGRTEAQMLTAEITFGDRIESAAAVHESSGEGVRGGEAILREGTPVALAFSRSLSSKTVAQGDTVSWVLVHDLVAGGVTVAKAGCRAVGEVSFARKAAVPGRSGALTLRFDHLKVGEKTVKLRSSKERDSENDVSQKLPYRLKWPLGLLRTGDDVEIRQGTVLAAFVAEDTSLPPAE